MKYAGFAAMMLIVGFCGEKEDKKPTSDPEPTAEQEASKAALDYVVKGKDPIPGYKKAAAKITGDAVRKVSVDLSSPNKTIESLLRAALHGDQDAFNDCLTEGFRAKLAKKDRREFFERSRRENEGKTLDWKAVSIESKRPAIHTPRPCRGFGVGVARWRSTWPELRRAPVSRLSA